MFKLYKKLCDMYHSITYPDAMEYLYVWIFVFTIVSCYLGAYIFVYAYYGANLTFALFLLHVGLVLHHYIVTKNNLK